jgi:hypothetical protein
MGFDIRLEDEHGQKVEEVGDPTNLLQRLLPSPKDETFSCLRFIDPYGDTVFNQIHIATFLAELERISVAATTDQERRLLESIRELAERCRSEPHLYVKFYGD